MSDTNNAKKKTPCKVCGKSLLFLDVHMKYSHGDKKFACDQCDKKFTSSNALKKHMDIHRELNCPVCDEKFVGNFHNFDLIILCNFQL